MTRQCIPAHFITNLVSLCVQPAFPNLDGPPETAKPVRANLIAITRFGARAETHGPTCIMMHELFFNLFGALTAAHCRQARAGAPFDSHTKPQCDSTQLRLRLRRLLSSTSLMFLAFYYRDTRGADDLHDKYLVLYSLHHLDVNNRQFSLVNSDDGSGRWHNVFREQNLTGL